MPQKRHVIFFDGMCGLCDHCVKWLFQKDKNKIFFFAPLQGKTAKKKLSHLPEAIKHADTMILIENYQEPDEKVYIFGRAALRVLWLLGGSFKAIGWINFFPSFFYNWIYWIIAKNRKKLFGTVEIQNGSDNNRFLP